MLKREPRDLLQWLFDEMANNRCRLVVIGEYGDVDVTWEEMGSVGFEDVAVGHGETFEEALDNMISNHNAALEAEG